MKLTNCNVVSTIRQEDDYEGWLEVRGKGIGGSDVGAICGVSEYSSARLVYLDKTGQYKKEFSTDSIERMRWGTILEPFVADEYSRRSGNTVVEQGGTLQHKDYPWALANVDRFILDDKGNPVGVLECKTAGEFMNSDWDEGDLPMSYIYQLNWYMWVTGLKQGAFACLVGGNKFYYYEVFFDEAWFMENIFKTVSAFWNDNIVKLVEPPLMGTGADSDYVKEKYQDVEKGSEKTLIEDDFDEMAATVKRLKLCIKEYTAELDEVSNKLKDALKKSEIGYTTNHVVKWSPRSRTTIDSKVLKAEFPDVYDVCKRTSHFRVFSVK